MTYIKLGSVRAFPDAKPTKEQALKRWRRRRRYSVRGRNGSTAPMSNGRANMLKPCPFCGEGEPFVQTSELGDYSIGARVVCPRCHVATSSEYMSSRMTYLPTGEDITRLLAIGKAISSWNRRAE